MQHPMERVALAQGVYYLVTGVWPIVNIRSFEVVTGPKVDRWLVKAVGAGARGGGAGLILAGARRRVTPELAVVAVGSAAGLTGIDLVYVAKRRIRPIYLLDAVAEVVLIAAWAAAWRRR
jgi:hypothetical protein